MRQQEHQKGTKENACISQQSLICINPKHEGVSVNLKDKKDSQNTIVYWPTENLRGNSVIRTPSLNKINESSNVTSSYPNKARRKLLT